MVENGVYPEVAGKRRMRSKRERRQVVEETMRPEAPSVAVIARAHGVNANQVFNWRRLYQTGRLDEKPSVTQLLPVRISNDSWGESPTVKERSVAGAASGAIHIELGRVRIRVEGSVDPKTLRLILEQLGR